MHSQERTGVTLPVCPPPSHIERGSSQTKYYCTDNIGAIFPVMDWLCREEVGGKSKRPDHAPALTVKTLLEAIVKAYEVQGCMLLRNAFNEFGLDHTILVKLASAAVVPWLLGLTKAQAAECISHVWMDSAPLRVYRSGSNTIPRKGWAAGDACQRAVEFALLTRAGQAGSRTPLSQPRWGFYTTTFRTGGKFVMPLQYSDWVVRNLFYKVMPVEGHGIAAVEATVIHSQQLRKRGLDPLKDIDKIVIRTMAAGKLIIDKTGPLRNHADRDHCMQYAVAVALLKGSSPESADFDDNSPFAISDEVDKIRASIEIIADPTLTAEYLSLEKKSMPSAVTIHLKGGEIVDEIVIDFPCGHVKHAETTAEVQRKFRRNLSLLFDSTEVAEIEGVVLQKEDMPVSELAGMLTRSAMQVFMARL